MTAIRVLLAIVFMTYGIIKVLGGQYYYGDWVMDKKTVDGTSLVWSFYGYSPIYGRFTGLFELVPGILLLFRRTATIGAAALFAVSLNITVMDFAFKYPDVKYAALLYTVLLAVLLWADRQKLRALLEDGDRIQAALAALPPAPAAPARPPMRRATRIVLLAGLAVVILGAMNLVLISAGKRSEAAAREYLADRVAPGQRLELLRYRSTGLVGLDWTETLEFVLVGSGPPDTVRVAAHRITGFLPWRVREAGRP